MKHLVQYALTEENTLRVGEDGRHRCRTCIRLRKERLGYRRDLA